MRIAILDKEKCQPAVCNFLCIRMCPGVRMGQETIVKGLDNKPVISEALCSGCGICVKKCPLQAISIINLPEELANPIHQFGVNGFRLYRLFMPKQGQVIGLIGRNATGKSTALKIISSQLIPNLGNLSESSFEKLLAFYKGKELHDFFLKAKNNEIKLSVKPQHIDLLSNFKGTLIEFINQAVKENLAKQKLDFILTELDLINLQNHSVNKLSGGELQRLAIATCLLKEADIYFFDEPSSYLDIYQRLKLAKILRNLVDKNKSVIVIEHDLAVLDYLSDLVHILFGKPGCYGIISQVKTVKNGINEFLQGFIKDENIRFRDNEINFSKISSQENKASSFIDFPAFTKTFPAFKLTVEQGNLGFGQVLGILGPNGIGKTTFVKILAGIDKSDSTDLSLNYKISYKPQYLKAEPDTTVEEFFANSNDLDSELLNNMIENKLNVRELFPKKLENLSGGELQRVAVAFSLAQQADFYLLDEPSAFLDVEQRLALAELLKQFTSLKKAVSIVVDHDLLFIDSISDRLLVFSGESGVSGFASKPVSLHDGMNSFLKSQGITYRRDHETGRPRVNKPDSILDKDQKASGEFYYEK